MPTVQLPDAMAKCVIAGTLLVSAGRHGGVSQPLVVTEAKPFAAEAAMKLSTKSTLLGVAAILLGVSPAVAQVGLTSSLATVTINATKSSVLSLAVNSGGTQTLASLTDNTTNNFASPVNITTTWDL